MGQSLTPVFSISSVMQRIERFRDERINVMVRLLAAVGEDAVNYMRELDTYRDQSVNLRSSTGFVIVCDGDIQMENFNPKGTAEGKATAKQVVTELIAENKDGLILICFAGMEYAAAVEANGYDVISGSVPAANILLKFLKEELGL